jgi:transcriptional regulator with XRE-family HTH domain
MTDRTSLPHLVHNVICGRKLESLRLTKGMTQKQVVEQFGGSQPKLVNIESGINGLNPNDLRRLLDIYEADAASREFCTTHAEAGRQWDRENKLRSRFDGDMRDHIDLEHSADSRCEHSSMIVPGLLQTEGYMRCLRRAGRPSPTPEQLDRFVDDRRTRQRVLDNEHQRFRFVIDEAALHRMEDPNGTSAVRREQLRCLAEAADRPNIEVRVVPFRHGYYLGQEEDYVIFGYDTGPAVEVIYVESYDGGTTVRNLARVRKYLSLWDHQRAAGLGPEQTGEFLADLARSS